MNPNIPQILKRMDQRLQGVESTLRDLNKQVQESSAGFQRHAEDFERRAEQMQEHAEQMRRDSERMQQHAAQLREDSGHMQQNSERMRLEVSSNSAAFDQATAKMETDLGDYRHGVGIVVSWLVTENAARNERQEDLVRRVETLERKVG